MEPEWDLLRSDYNTAGAREAFENICTLLYQTLYPNIAYSVKVWQGDDGIDIFIGEIGFEPIKVIQCKFFPTFGESQKSQITRSFKTALTSENYEVKEWILCIANDFTVSDHLWWSKWKNNQIEKFNLPTDFIILKEGKSLINLLKINDLYNTAFNKTDSLRIEKLFEHASANRTIPQNELDATLKKSSDALYEINNFFGNNNSTHIPREETDVIFNWVENDLKKETNNILILTGEKGIGKSVVLKDVYDKLIQANYQVLGIKADKYYCANIKDLENHLFFNNITFDTLCKSVIPGQKLVVIIDQIDALSYSITSNREFISTYNRLISEFKNQDHIRVILSTRTYDLEYDADLSVYNTNSYLKVKVKPLSADRVIQVLNNFDISTIPNKFLELLKIPNNLNVFCSLPKKTKVIYDAISSLKDLYDELWYQLISSSKNKKIKTLIYAIVARMSEEGIAIGNIYNDEYFEEINYLKSNNIIIENNRSIQFFHQTFYEYCFAKQFVETNKPLHDYIVDNGQSLYIRSVVKLVIEYLREYNITQYIHTLNKILFGEKYRFHIKTLLITCISIQENLHKQEKFFFLDKIVNSDLQEAFFTSIYSQQWIHLFIEEKIFDNSFDSEKRGFIWSLFVRNINHGPLEVLKYLDSLEFDDKHNFIKGIIIYIDNWKEKDLLDFFSKYFRYQQSNDDMSNHSYYNILEKVFVHHPKFVYEEIEQPLKDTYKDFQHDIEYPLNELLVEISKLKPTELFYFLLKILKDSIETSQFPIITEPHKIKTPFYDSYKNVMALSTIHKENTIVFHLVKLVEKLSESEFNDFFNEYKKDNDVNVIQIIIQGLRKRKQSKNELIIELIKIVDEKNGFKGRDDDFQLGLRMLISERFQTFPDDFQNYIINLYLNMTSIYDTYIFKEGDKKRYSLRNFGEKKFVFIKSLPDDVLEGNEKLKKEYQSLFRKFGNIDHTERLDGGGYRSGVVSAPLSKSAYQNMNLKSWKRSMLKYNSSYKSKEFLKGGMWEHSISFKETVTQNPGKFYDFLSDLFDDINIDVCYLSHGIDGLIEGKYEPEKVKTLYKKLIRRNLDKEYILYSNWQVRYLVENNIIDKEIVEHISDIAKNYSIQEKDHNPNHLLMDSINSVRGSAVDILMHLYQNKEYEEILFTTIEEVIRNCNLSLKVLIVHNIAYLNHLNIQRAFEVFKTLVSTKNDDILKHSIDSGQYYNNAYHEEMESYFIDLMENENTQKTNYVLVKSYLEEKKYGLKYFRQFIAKGKSAIFCTLKVAEKYLFKKGSINDRALDILYQFIGTEDVEIAREYGAIILRKFKVQNFLDLYDFMLVYSKSKVCKISPHHFLNYLISCSKDYPDQCLELVGNIDFSREPNIREAGFYNKEPIQLILGIYSKLLSQHIIDEGKVEKCLNIFDNMLKHNHLRDNANNAIELLVE